MKNFYFLKEIEMSLQPLLLRILPEPSPEPTSDIIPPLELLRLVRTLSTQHWLAGERLLRENNSLRIRAGRHREWSFYLSRPNSASVNFTRETYQYGALISVSRH